MCSRAQTFDPTKYLRSSSGKTFRRRHRLLSACVILEAKAPYAFWNTHREEHWEEKKGRARVTIDLQDGWAPHLHVQACSHHDKAFVPTTSTSVSVESKSRKPSFFFFFF
jgi:hypothetical protein